MRKIFNSIIFLFILLLLIPSSAFAKKPPKWANKVHWEDGEYHYFVGVSTNSASEETARREALDNATAEAMQSIFGISGKMDLASFANLQKIQISQDVFVSTDEIQIKPMPVDIYVERIKGQNETKYNVYRSIKVSKKDAKKELDRLKETTSKKKNLEGKVLEPDKDVVAVTFESEGVIIGEDEPSAKAGAIRVGLSRSCERLLKEWFYAETLQKNYPRLNSTIYEKCPSFSKNYEIRNGLREGNVYKISMTVYLNSGDMRRKLMDMGLYREK